MGNLVGFSGKVLRTRLRFPSLTRQYILEQKKASPFGLLGIELFPDIFWRTLPVFCLIAIFAGYSGYAGCFPLDWRSQVELGEILPDGFEFPRTRLISLNEPSVSSLGLAGVSSEQN